MAKFYGEVQGARGPVHRLGHQDVRAVVASWQGAVATYMYEDHGEIRVRVTTTPWQGQGQYQLLFDGPLSVMQAGASPPNVIGIRPAGGGNRRITKLSANSGR